MPVLILGGIYSGIFTPTEAGAVSAVYAILISVVIYRSLTWSVFRDSMRGTAGTLSAVFIILAAVMVFSVGMTYAHVPQTISEFVASAGIGKNAMLFATVLLLFAFGCVIETIPIMFVVVPILWPTLEALGVDPIHFGVVVVSSTIPSKGLTGIEPVYNRCSDCSCPTKQHHASCPW